MGAWHCRRCAMSTRIRAILAFSRFVPLGTAAVRAIPCNGLGSHPPAVAFPPLRWVVCLLVSSYSLSLVAGWVGGMLIFLASQERT